MFISLRSIYIAQFELAICLRKACLRKVKEVTDTQCVFLINATHTICLPRRTLVVLETPPRTIAIEANAMQGDREECLAASMDDCVTKPIRVDALIEALTQAKTRDAN